MALIVAMVLSYLLGSIPTGLWLGQWLRGIDVREHGSGNIGATNTLRVLGKGLGAAALAGDVLKGVIPVVAIARLSGSEYAPMLCGVAAIVGHTAPLYLKFKGGKGVATSAGVFLGLSPLPMLIALAVFIAVVAVTHMVSAGSISAAVALVAAINLLPSPGYLRIIAAALAILVVWRHRTNIQRILHGNESRLW